MTAIHRPLSPWVARLPLDPAAPIVVNDGDHRADARFLPQFATGWKRIAVRLDQLRTGLGLALEDGTAVVEIDDYGRPIAAAPAEVEVVAAIEAQWPSLGSGTAAQLSTLATASPWLRFWLLERLRAEGNPDDEAFTILPWHLLDSASRSVTRMLRGGSAEEEAAHIAHWLTPAIVGPCGALEQLDEGLLSGNPRMARVGAAAFLDSFRDVVVERIPQRTRMGLLDLVEVIGGLDPLYLHSSRVVASRLRGDTTVPRLQGTFDSVLLPAAGNEKYRDVEVNFDEQSHLVSMVETRAGWLELLVEIRAADGDRDGPIERLDLPVQPVRVTSDESEGTSTFWIPLDRIRNRWTGGVDFPLPDGVSVVDVEDVPIDPTELVSVPVPELVRSMELGTGSAMERWEQIAASLPDHHPVVQAFREYRTPR